MRNALDKWFGVSGNWALLVAGVALIVTLIQSLDGVAGATYRKRRARRERRDSDGQRQAAPPHPEVAS